MQENQVNNQQPMADPPVKKRKREWMLMTARNHGADMGSEVFKTYINNMVNLSDEDFRTRLPDIYRFLGGKRGKYTAEQYDKINQGFYAEDPSVVATQKPEVQKKKTERIQTGSELPSTSQPSPSSSESFVEAGDTGRIVASMLYPGADTGTPKVVRVESSEGVVKYEAPETEEVAEVPYQNNASVFDGGTTFSLDPEEQSKPRYNPFVGAGERIRLMNPNYMSGEVDEVIQRLESDFKRFNVDISDNGDDGVTVTVNNPQLGGPVSEDFVVYTPSRMATYGDQRNYKKNMPLQVQKIKDFLAQNIDKSIQKVDYNIRVQNNPYEISRSIEDIKYDNMRQYYGKYFRNLPVFGEESPFQSIKDPVLMRSNSADAILNRLKEIQKQYENEDYTWFDQNKIPQSQRRDAYRGLKEARKSFSIYVDEKEEAFSITSGDALRNSNKYNLFDHTNLEHYLHLNNAGIKPIDLPTPAIKINGKVSTVREAHEFLGSRSNVINVRKGLYTIEIDDSQVADSFIGEDLKMLQNDIKIKDAKKSDIIRDFKREDFGSDVEYNLALLGEKALFETTENAPNFIVNSGKTAYYTVREMVGNSIYTFLDMLRATGDDADLAYEYLAAKYPLTGNLNPQLIQTEKAMSLPVYEGGFTEGSWRDFINTGSDVMIQSSVYSGLMRFNPALGASVIFADTYGRNRFEQEQMLEILQDKVNSGQRLTPTEEALVDMSRFNKVRSSFSKAGVEAGVTYLVTGNYFKNIDKANKALKAGKFTDAKRREALREMALKYKYGEIQKLADIFGISPKVLAREVPEELIIANTDYVIDVLDGVKNYDPDEWRRMNKETTIGSVFSSAVLTTLGNNMRDSKNAKAIVEGFLNNNVKFAGDFDRINRLQFLQKRIQTLSFTPKDKELNKDRITALESEYQALLKQNDYVDKLRSDVIKQLNNNDKKRLLDIYIKILDSQERLESGDITTPAEANAIANKIMSASKEAAGILMDKPSAYGFDVLKDAGIMVNGRNKYDVILEQATNQLKNEAEKDGQFFDPEKPNEQNKILNRARNIYFEQAKKDKKDGDDITDFANSDVLATAAMELYGDFAEDFEVRVNAIGPFLDEPFKYIKEAKVKLTDDRYNQYIEDVNNKTEAIIDRVNEFNNKKYNRVEYNIDNVSTEKADSDLLNNIAERRAELNNKIVEIDKKTSSETYPVEVKPSLLKEKFDLATENFELFLLEKDLTSVISKAPSSDVGQRAQNIAKQLNRAYKDLNDFHQNITDKLLAIDEIQSAVLEMMSNEGLDVDSDLDMEPMGEGVIDLESIGEGVDQSEFGVSDTTDDFDLDNLSLDEKQALIQKFFQNNPELKGVLEDAKDQWQESIIIAQEALRKFNALEAELGPEFEQAKIELLSEVMSTEEYTSLQYTLDNVDRINDVLRRIEVLHTMRGVDSLHPTHSKLINEFVEDVTDETRYPKIGQIETLLNSIELVEELKPYLPKDGIRINRQLKFGEGRNLGTDAIINVGLYIMSRDMVSMAHQLKLIFPPDIYNRLNPKFQEALGQLSNSKIESQKAKDDIVSKFKKSDSQDSYNSRKVNDQAYMINMLVRKYQGDEDVNGEFKRAQQLILDHEEILKEELQFAKDQYEQSVMRKMPSIGLSNSKKRMIFAQDNLDSWTAQIDALGIRSANNFSDVQARADKNILDLAEGIRNLFDTKQARERYIGATGRKGTFYEQGTYSPLRMAKYDPQTKEYINYNTYEGLSADKVTESTSGYMQEVSRPASLYDAETKQPKLKLDPLQYTDKIFNVYTSVLTDKNAKPLFDEINLVLQNPEFKRGFYDKGITAGVYDNLLKNTDAEVRRAAQERETQPLTFEEVNEFSLQKLGSDINQWFTSSGAVQALLSLYQRPTQYTSAVSAAFNRLNNINARTYLGARGLEFLTFNSGASELRTLTPRAYKNALSNLFVIRDAPKANIYNQSRTVSRDAINSMFQLERRKTYPIDTYVTAFGKDLSDEQRTKMEQFLNKTLKVGQAMTNARFTYDQVVNAIMKSNELSLNIFLSQGDALAAKDVFEAAYLDYRISQGSKYGTTRQSAAQWWARENNDPDPEAIAYADTMIDTMMKQADPISEANMYKQDPELGPLKGGFLKGVTRMVLPFGKHIMNARGDFLVALRDYTDPNASQEQKEAAVTTMRSRGIEIGIFNVARFQYLNLTMKGVVGGLATTLFGYEEDELERFEGWTRRIGEDYLPLEQRGDFNPLQKVNERMREKGLTPSQAANELYNEAESKEETNAYNKIRIMNFDQFDEGVRQIDDLISQYDGWALEYDNKFKLSNPRNVGRSIAKETAISALPIPVPQPMEGIVSWGINSLIGEEGYFDEYISKDIELLIDNPQNKEGQENIATFAKENLLGVYSVNLEMVQGLGRAYKMAKDLKITNKNRKIDDNLYAPNEYQRKKLIQATQALYGMRLYQLVPGVPAKEIDRFADKLERAIENHFTATRFGLPSDHVDQDLVFMKDKIVVNNLGIIPATALSMGTILRDDMPDKDRDRLRKAQRKFRGVLDPDNKDLLDDYNDYGPKPKGYETDDPDYIGVNLMLNFMMSKERD